MKPSLLIAGIGNIFFGDDAFGCEVARELMGRPLPDGVRVEDFGIRGYDLAYALMEGCDTILVDAVPRGEAPGTLYLIEPEIERLDGAAAPDGHTMTPASVLQLVHSLSGAEGVKLGRLYLVGCEPGMLETEDGGMSLSESVQAAVPRAIEMIESLMHELLGTAAETGLQAFRHPELVEGSVLSAFFGGGRTDPSTPLRSAQDDGRENSIRSGLAGAAKEVS